MQHLTDCGPVEDFLIVYSNVKKAEGCATVFKSNSRSVNLQIAQSITIKQQQRSLGGPEKAVCAEAAAGVFW